MMTKMQFIALLSASRQLLLVIGAGLGGDGLLSKGAHFWIETIAGLLLVVPSAAWEVYDAVMNIVKAHAVGAAAGMAMTLQGKAIAEDGTTITNIGDASAGTPPKPVTLATGAEIVKDFGPAVSSIQKI